MPEKLVREVGNWVSGDRFWDREDELRDLIELLNEGANILLTGQRRMGKTSIVRETGQRLTDNYYCLQIDVERCDSPADVIAEICVAAKKHLPLWYKIKDSVAKAFTKTIDSIESLSMDRLSIELRQGATTAWQDKGDQIMSALTKLDRPVILFIDEFPIVVSRMLMGRDYIMNADRKSTTELFVSWIRHLTIEHKGQLRIVLSGSIGLEPILKRAQLSSTITTFTSFEVKPWEQKIARGCIQALCNNYRINLSDTVTTSMLSLIGCCVPHHVQMFFSYIYDDCKRRDSNKATKEDIARIYAQDMLGKRGHPELSTYEERLTMVLGPNRDLAFQLLTDLAVSGKLSTADVKERAHVSIEAGKATVESVPDVINILEHDGYIKALNGEYRFVSSLLRDWWKARFAGL